MGMATADDSDSDNEYDDFRTKLGSPTTPVNGSSSSSSGSGKITQYTLNTDGAFISNNFLPTPQPASRAWSTAKRLYCRAVQRAHEHAHELPV